MEYREIEELLTRYLEGETTLEEEALLKEHFSQPGIPPEQRDMQEMFRYFAKAEQEASARYDISAELNAIIDNEWKKETRSNFRRVYIWAGSAAAILAISFGIYKYQNKPVATVKDSFTDPKLAYIETKQALLLVSRAMNRHTTSLKYLARIDETFNRATKIAEIDKVVNSVKNK